MFSLITLFARQVASKDGARGKDVEIFKDKECTDLYVRIPWWHASKPSPKTKKVTLNCYRWNLQWI